MAQLIGSVYLSAGGSILVSGVALGRIGARREVYRSFSSARVHCVVQKRRNRNLRLSEFGVNDVLLPQDLLDGPSTISLQSTEEFGSFISPAALVGRVWEALTEKNARN